MHPSCAEVGCVLTVLCIFLMLRFEPIKSTLCRKKYNVPPWMHRVVKQGWLPRAINIQAAYLDYVPFLFSLATFFLCEDNKRIDLVILYCVVLPFFPFSTKRQETSFSTTTAFPLFNQDAGSIPSLFYSTTFPPFFPYSTQTWISLHEVGFPLIVQIKFFVCMTSRG